MRRPSRLYRGRWVGGWVGGCGWVGGWVGGLGGEGRGGLIGVLYVIGEWVAGWVGRRWVGGWMMYLVVKTAHPWATTPSFRSCKYPSNSSRTCVY